MASITKQSGSQPSPLAPRLKGLLRGLRWRIRAYTLLRGVCLIVCWLVLMFWFALLCDYGPVWMGASEMPRVARAVLLIIAGVGAAYIGYQWIVRRTFAHLADHSMAILLERQHQQFRDSLLTSVEMHERPDHALDFNQEMLAHAGDEALANAPSVRLRRVLRWQPLVLSFLAALLLSSTVVAFAVLPGSQDAFRTAAERVVLLDDEPWKRMALLRVQGISRWTYEYDAPEAGAETSLKSDRPRLLTVDVPFDENRTVRVARGSNVTLKIDADIAGHTRPSNVNLFWTNTQGSGRATMAEGDTNNGWLTFLYLDAPFKGIDESVEFDALGYDYRTKRYQIEVEDEPGILDVQLVYDRPTYLVDEDRSVFRRVEEPLIAGTLVPRGSRVTFQVQTNKPLRRVYVYDLEKKTTRVIEPQGSEKQRESVSYTIDKLDRPVALEWMLEDDHGLVNESPHSTNVGVREDALPKVDVALRGIGSAITPDAMFRLAGRVEDDYWLDRAWLEVERGQQNWQLPLPIQRGGFSEFEVTQWEIQPDDNLHHQIDLRDERSRDENPLALQPGDKITIGVKAADLYDLDGFEVTGNPHAGAGDRYQLDVVTPDELLSLLERRELELRRRLEQIVEELTQMRDSLVRVQLELTSDESADDASESPDRETDTAAEPGDQPLSAEEKALRMTALRKLRVQRAVNQSEKSRGETEGVGHALLDVVAQLENNRVDTEDRKERLGDQVAAPLLALVSDDFIELDKRLAGLNTEVNQSNGVDREKAALAAEHAVAQTDQVLLKLDGVLQKMVDMESFNELIDLVRSIIDDQDTVTEDTKTLRKKQLFGLE